MTELPVSLNWSIENLSLAHQGGPNVVEVTTQRLLEVCAGMDSSAYWAAVRGLIAMILLIVWTGRIRKKLLATDHGRVVVFGERLLMTYAALQFVFVIVNLLRAG